MCTITRILSCRDCFLDAHLSLVQCFHFSLFTASGTLTLDALEVYSRELLSASDIPLRASDIFGEVLPRLSATSRISAVDSSIFSDLAALLLKNTRLFRAVDNNLVDPLVVLVDQASSNFSKDGQYGSFAAQIINEVTATPPNYHIFFICVEFVDPTKFSDSTIQAYCWWAANNEWSGIFMW